MIFKTKKPSVQDIWSLAFQQQQLMISAYETMWRRSLMFWMGTMTPLQATAMVTEKPVAFASGVEKATLAVARNKNAVVVASAGLKPIVAKTSANARALRQKK